MSKASDPAMLLLSAEITEECRRIAECVAEIPAAIAALRETTPRTLEVYGAAALLDRFYSGIEKALHRIARTTTSLPAGSAWHRELLESSALEIPRLRPAILSSASVTALDPFLSFRHRFRHQYVFDLDHRMMLPLLERAGATWAATEPELQAFAERITTW
jgi:hypothetical protein